MIDLSIKNTEKYFGAEHILKGVSFELNQGDRVALIGENGSGKTTLFKIINGEENSDNGEIHIRKSIKIGYLSQIPKYNSEITVKGVLDLALEEILELKKKLEDIQYSMKEANEKELNKLITKYGELQSKFEYLGGYRMEDKVSRVAKGLGIDDDYLSSKFNELSGGEKTKVMLGQLLIKKPDILLLDEPTNHLDIQSVEWLEEYIKDYNGTVLIISHDRYFLDKTITRVLELDRGIVKEYIGNYTKYIEEREKHLENQLNQYENQKKKIKQMEEAIERFKVWGNKADSEAFFKKAKNMEKRIEKMDKIDKPIMEKKKISLGFDMVHRSGKDVLIGENISKFFDDELILDSVDFKVYFGEKVGLLGKNGSGKSTLFKIILGEYNKDSGELNVGSRVKIGYLSQEPRFDGENKNLLDFIRYDFNIGEEETRNMLATVKFIGDDVYKKISALSGGERIRLRLCQLMNSEINLLLLDEPTNHLDISSREMLEDSLQDFGGTMFFISHDRYFINKLAKKIFNIHNKKIVEYLGDYDYYKEKRNELEEKEYSEKSLDLEKSNEVEKNNKKIKPSKNKLKKINELEDDISRLEKSIKSKQEDMNDNGSNLDKLEELFREKESLIERLDNMMEEWLRLKEEVDNK